MHIGFVVFGHFQDLLGTNSAGGIKARMHWVCVIGVIAFFGIERGSEVNRLNVIADFVFCLY